MTFGQSSVARSFSRTQLFLKKQLWIWPIIAVALLSLAGYLVSSSINATMRASLQSEMETLLQVEQSMLEKWFKVQESSAQTLANDPEIRQTILKLLEYPTTPALSATAGAGMPGEAESQRLALRLQLRKLLENGMTAHDFVGYVVANKQKVVVAAQTEELIGQSVEQYDEILTMSLAGEATVSVPFPSLVMLRDRNGRVRSETPTMFVCTPVRDENLQIVAVLAMRIQPEKEFTGILHLGRLGETGETYAVNKQGLIVSNSRFDEQLILLGIIPDEEGAASILKLQVRNPGGNIAEGFRPKVRRAEMPLTASCSAVTAGGSGCDLEGYPDYRGIPSVGAWTWLPKYKLGLITEMDMAEAYRPLTILNRAFYALYGLLVTSAIAIFAFTVIVARLQREAQKAVVQAKHLGQYRLEARLGAGAMGVVYKGHHAMLRRPTAIKMLQVDRISESAIARFEREVQLTSQLNHPNTIAIYDFGRTPEGVFYYAMEYLDGIDLQTLVERYGPQPEARVAHILAQICGSLYEAHSLGLVHRDIKPANIVLNRRGGEADVVKVLDFGLVKSLGDSNRSGESVGLSGTPLYMSPEAIQLPDSVDGRSDLYAVGAVGYYLLTGKTVFDAESLTELCKHHLTSIPESPSVRLGKAVSPGLEHALMACLEKSRAKRPQTARELMKMLEASPSLGEWSQDDAEGWWGRHERELAKGRGEPVEESEEVDRLPSQAAVVQRPATASSGFDQTIATDFRDT
jgi:tRNA A-37 threonylcarbamoyl transferase component Bud32